MVTWNLIEYPNEWLDADCDESGICPAVLLKACTANNETGDLGGHRTRAFNGR